MQKPENNYAFVDSQNVNLGIRELGWKYGKQKLEVVISPNQQKCSILLKKSAKEKIVFMNNLERKLAYHK